MTSLSALVVRGGWDGHAPVATTDSFVPFLRANGYEVRVEESTAVYGDAQVMAATDVIIQAVTMSEISDAEVAGLCAAVRNGTGLTGWHGGIVDSFRGSSDYLQLVGGQFAAHPSKEAASQTGEGADYALRHTIEFTDLGRRHPITAGLDDFEIETEQYWVLHDDYSEVLATTTHPVRPWHPWNRPVRSPAVWTRAWGAGRVVVATPGHSLELLAHPGLRTIIERGILWATRTGSRSSD